MISMLIEGGIETVIEICLIVEILRGGMLSH